MDVLFSTHSMSLEQQALDRKARLAGLKRSRTQQEPAAVTKKLHTEEPSTEEITASIEPSNPPSFTQDGETVEAISAQLEKQILASVNRQEDGTFSGPENKTRPTRYLDFKRDLKEDVKVLSQRTETSIQEMIKARLEEVTS